MPLPPIPPHDGPQSAKITFELPHSVNMYFRPMLMSHGWIAKLSNALFARLKSACEAEGVKAEYAIDSEDQVAKVLEKMNFNHFASSSLTLKDAASVKADAPPAPKGRKKTAT